MIDETLVVASCASSHWQSQNSRVKYSYISKIRKVQMHSGNYSL